MILQSGDIFCRNKTTIKRIHSEQILFRRNSVLYCFDPIFRTLNAKTDSIGKIRQLWIFYGASRSAKTGNDAQSLTENSPYDGQSCENEDDDAVLKKNESNRILTKIFEKGWNPIFEQTRLNEFPNGENSISLI